MSMSQRSIAVSTTRRPYDSTPLRSHARSHLAALRMLFDWLVVGQVLGEAPKSVGSNGETVLRLKGERAFEVDVWTFNRRCRLL